MAGLAVERTVQRGWGHGREIKEMEKGERCKMRRR
jgi:hypothetical protein